MLKSANIIPMFSVAEINLFDAIHRVINAKRFVLGNEVHAFEAEFSDYLKVHECVTVANGTDALQLALKGLGIGVNDKVVTVANAGFYSSSAIYAVGAKPLYVDIDEKTLTMSSQALFNVLHKKPKAIIVTHLYGKLANIDAILDVCNAAKLPLIEDCAQAHGARLNETMSGAFGTVACFSFYPTKNLGAIGDGGAVVTNNKDLAAKIRQLRQYGWNKKYHVEIPWGQNSRLDEIQAAILREKLPYLDQWNTARRNIARRYNKAFSLLPVHCPYIVNQEYVAHLYVLRVKNREVFRQYLKDHGIATDIHYPIPDHQQLAYEHENDTDLSVTEYSCNEVVTLPCFPEMTDYEVNTVIDVVKEYFKS